MTGSPQERTFGRGRFRTGHGAGFRRIAEKIEGICLQRRRSCREARADLDRERDRVDRKHGPEHAAIGRVPTMRGRANRNDRSNPRPWVASAEYQAYVDAADAAAQSLYTAIISGASSEPRHKAANFCKVQFRVASTPGMSSFELLI